MKSVSTFLGGIFTLWVLAVTVEKISIYTSTPPSSAPSTEVGAGETGVLKRKEKPAVVFSEGFEGSPPRKFVTNPVAQKSSNPLVDEMKSADLKAAEWERYHRQKWDVALKNQIRIVSKDLRLGISEGYATSKIAEYEDWIGFRKWQGDYPETVKGLAAKKAQWETIEIELPRRLDNCLKKVRYMKTVNDEALENINEFIEFFRK